MGFWATSFWRFGCEMGKGEREGEVRMMRGGEEVRSENMKRVAKERAGKKEVGGGKGEGQGDIFWTPEDPRGPQRSQRDLRTHRVYQMSDISATVWKHLRSRDYSRDMQLNRGLLLGLAGWGRGAGGTTGRFGPSYI
jgi:hypothetical protein